MSTQPKPDMPHRVAWRVRTAEIAVVMAGGAISLRVCDRTGAGTRVVGRIDIDENTAEILAAALHAAAEQVRRADQRLSADIAACASPSP